MTRPTVREDLASLEGYHSPQVDVDVRLNTNEAPGPPPAAFAEAVGQAAAATAWHRYPDRAATALRTALAELYSTDDKPVTIDQIFCANGSNEVLQTILLTYAGPGRSVLTFEPTYALHTHIARLTGAERIQGERTDEFLIDADNAVALINEHRPSVTFVCSPNNPTGMIEPTETILAMLEAVESVGGLLVVDEAYGQFSDWSALAVLDEDRSLAVSRTFSKTWAMAGARLGYLLAPTWLVADLDKVVLPYHIDSVKQAAGLVALDFVDDMDERVSTIVEERGRISVALDDLGCTVWPSGANFILFRPPAGDGDRVWAELVERSVLIRNTASWNHLGGCLRVTVGTREDNDRFLDALNGVLNPS